MRRSKKPRTELNHRRSRSITSNKSNDNSTTAARDASADAAAAGAASEACTASSSTQSTPDASLLFWISALCRPSHSEIATSEAGTQQHTAEVQATTNAADDVSQPVTSTQAMREAAPMVPTLTTPCVSSSSLSLLPEAQTRRSASPVPLAQLTETPEQQLQHYIQLACDPSAKAPQAEPCVPCSAQDSLAEGSSSAQTHGGLTSSESNKQGNTDIVPQQHQEHQQQEEEDKKVKEADEAAQRPHTGTSTRVELRDVMPLYPALLAGELGPVMVDVQLLGNISLLQQPGVVGRVLDEYEQADSAALRRLLRSAQLFLVVRETSFYTICPAHYPVLPLLARLLLAPSVVKVVMHLPLLCRLLFLFLGSDRVDVVNVVDVEVWSEVLQQQYGGSTRRSAMDEQAVADDKEEDAEDAAAPPHVSRGRRGHRRRRRDAEDGRRAWRAVHSIHDVLAVLPADVHEVLASYRETVQRRLQQQQQQIHHEEEEEEEGEEGKGEKAHTVSDPLRGDDDEDEEDDDRSTSSSSMNSSHDMAHATQRSVSKRRSAHTAHEEWCAGQDAAAVAHCFAHLAALATYYQTLLTSRMAEGSAAWQLAARRSYATVLCALMSYHGIFVSKARYDAMQADLEAQIRDLCAYGEARLSASHTTVPPARGARQNTRRPARGTLMQQLSAEDVVEHVLRHCNARTRAALTSDAADNTNNNNNNNNSSNSSSTTKRAPQNRQSAAFVRYCLQVLRAQPHDAAAAQEENSSRHESLVVLLSTWLAIDERREYKRTLRDLLSSSAPSNGGKLSVRVVPTNTSTAAQACREGSAGTAAMSDLCVCFSVHPHWEVHNTTTGRIFASMPNVQTLPKQPAMAAFALPAATATAARMREADIPDHNNSTSENENGTGQGAVSLSQQQQQEQSQPGQDNTRGVCADPVPMLRTHPDWTVRHLYLAPPGCLLVSLDYNQIELRVLAHLCRDATLLRQLTNDEDVLRQMAQAMLRTPSVADWQRQAVKVIVYGLLYGMGMQRMEELMASLFDKHKNKDNTQAKENGQPSRLSARELVAAFDRVYPGVHRYLRNTRLQALHEKTVQTLSGLKDLSAEPDPGRRRQNSVAWAVQGGAADVLHSAMRAIHEQRHDMVPFLPAAPLALIMAVHDELVYAVPRAAMDVVVPKLRLLMEEQSTALNLCVPLRVSVRVGPSLGELRSIEHT